MSSTPTTLRPELVILRAADWTDELSGELQRLGIPRTKARASAVALLRRILDRCGWPAECFLIDTDAIESELEPSRQGPPSPARRQPSRAERPSAAELDEAEDHPSHREGEV